MDKHKRNVLKVLVCIMLFAVIVGICTNVNAADGDIFGLPSIDINIGGEESSQETSSTLQILTLITIITLAPSLLIMLTCFTRIIISLHFLRAALGTQQLPPNQILIGIAIILTIFIMGSTFNDINENAIKPYSDGQISQEEFYKEAMQPIREFMFNQVESKDLKLFTDIAGVESYKSKEDIPSSVLVPAFIIGELTKGFKIGFVIYLPFIAIDMIVSSTLMAMGMMMLPPAQIAAPFKLLLFILVDGWSLVIESLLRTFR